METPSAPYDPGHLESEPWQIERSRQWPSYDDMDAAHRDILQWQADNPIEFANLLSFRPFSVVESFEYQLQYWLRFNRDVFSAWDHRIGRTTISREDYVRFYLESNR